MQTLRRDPMYGPSVTGFDHIYFKVLKPDKVTAVACGRHHTVVALVSGTIMAFGSNNEGQLGIGREPEWTNVPMGVTGILVFVVHG